MRPSILFLPLLLVAMACGGTTASPAASDGGALPCSPGDKLSCFGGSLSDHVCGDSGTVVTCQGGRLECPAGTIPESACWCNTLASCGPNVPLGTCTPSGWSCGGAKDASAEASPGTCHGFCPQPNGASCQSDCDCYGKCVAGRCVDPPHPTITCTGDAAACPSGQTCAFGVCEGATCSASDDCPRSQQCMAQKCAFYGCI